MRTEFDPTTLTHRIDLTMPGEVKAVPPTVTRLMEAVREMACAKGKEFEIELALTEALANAVEHGCKGDAGKSVQVTAACDPTRGMLVVVRDPGTGFDPAAVPSPIVGERIYSEGGRGIFLINRLMDEIRYERGGTEIWMVKR
jgi:serine/threonine-protein kinase RsbW